MEFEDAKWSSPEAELLIEKDRPFGHSYWTTFLFLFKYLQSDIEKRPRSFHIGVFSIFLVVAFLSFLLSTVLLGGVIYLKIAENEMSEADIILLPVSASNDTRTDAEKEDDVLTSTFGLINYREVEDTLAEAEQIEGVSPRWILPASVYDASDESDTETNVYLIVADTRKERDIGFGRSFNQRILGYGEAYASASIMRVLGINDYEGQHLRLKIDIVESFAQAGIIDNYNTTEDAVKEFLDDFDITDEITDITISGDDINEFFDSDVTDTDFEDITISADVVEDIVVDTLVAASVITFDFTVVEAVEKADGKWQSSLGNVILIDSNYVQVELIDSIKLTLEENLNVLGTNTLTEDIIQALEDIDIYNYTLFANIIAKDRIDLYTGTVEHMQYRITKITNELYDLLGYGHPTYPQVLLSVNMEGVQIVKTFLNNVFMAVLAFLTILSVLLIYTLMMGDIEQKTYEFGMLRALGMKQVTLINYLIMFSSYFSIPGLVTGIFLSFLLNLVAAFGLSQYTGLPVSVILNPAAFIIGVLMGFGMPLFSTYIPIKRALTKNLRDSLDLYHRIVSTVAVTIQKLEKMGLSPPTLVSSLLLVILGFLTYYLVPLAFQLGKFEIFLFLLNVILLVMIIGFTFVCHMIQPYLEQWFASLLLYLAWKDRNLKTIVKNNLHGHSSRNWKTSLMFCMSLSFVIFSGVAFRLQGSIIKNTVKMTFGGDLYIMAPTDDLEGLKEAEIRDWIENTYKRENGDYIKSYTFVSYGMSELPNVVETDIGNLCGFPNYGTTLVAVEEDYLKAVHNEFFIPTESQSGLDYPEISGEDDLIYGLYTNQNLQTFLGDPDFYDVLSGNTDNLSSTQITTSDMFPVKLMIPEGMREIMSVDTKTPASLLIEFENYESDITFRASVRGMAQKFPGFFFSGYSPIAFFSTTIISYPDYREIIDRLYRGNWPEDLTDSIDEGTTYDIPKQIFLVLLNGNVDQGDRDVLANGLRNLFRSDTTILIDVAQLVETAELTVTIMEAFFILVGMIAFVLAFFLLWTSFTGNVRENSWEYGVLRSIGLTSKQCTRIYIYESLLLVVTASLLGSAIGILIAVVLSVQMNLFTELPFNMEFPVTMFILMITASVVTGIMGSYYPAKQIEKYQISAVLKGINF